jgi:hypothetical protein
MEEIRGHDKDRKVNLNILHRSPRIQTPSRSIIPQGQIPQPFLEPRIILSHLLIGPHNLLCHGRDSLLGRGKGSDKVCVFVAESMLMLCRACMSARAL